MLELFDDSSGFSDDAAYSGGVTEEAEGHVAGGDVERRGLAFVRGAAAVVGGVVWFEHG